MANNEPHPAYTGLSSAQSTALAKLQELCQQQGVLWPTSTIAEMSSEKGDNDPFTLLYAGNDLGGARVLSWIERLLTAVGIGDIYVRASSTQMLHSNNMPRQQHGDEISISKELMIALTLRTLRR